MYFSHFAPGSFGGHHSGIFVRTLDRRDHLVKRQLNDGLRRRIEMHLRRLVVGVARLMVPVLAFPFVRRQPDALARSEMELAHRH